MWAIIIIIFPSSLLSSCQIFLPSLVRTDWLSGLGLGNQVGSTTDHLAVAYPARMKIEVRRGQSWECRDILPLPASHPADPAFILSY